MDPRLRAALEGRYVIDREIGAGGMATVYLARDVRHNRNVALKVLNPELGAILGVERFLAEIEVTANLQHPNLLPLFDSGEAGGLLFYVMPYIEGETLRARLEREKQLPVDEAVRLATTIASALDYAHLNNDIHRDLKPENVLLHEGQPLVADFGIALAVSNAGGARITQTGLSLGTPQYMSPEQAAGDRVVDGRTDIYSLGAITYEMLVGDPPHVASTAQAIIAKVLTERPSSVRTSRPSVPEHVADAVQHALEKLPADRFATAREFADALDGKAAYSGARARTSAVAPRSPRVRELIAWTLAAAMTIAFGVRQLAPPVREEPPVVRATFDLPPGIHVADGLTGNTLAVSPKGDMIAFTTIAVSGYRLYVRHLNELAAREISDALGSYGARNLAFSPDGRWIVFTEGNFVKKVSVDGGQPKQIASNGVAAPLGVVWSQSDSIYIGSYNGLWVVPASGGVAVQMKGDSPGALREGRRWPLLLPGGKAAIVVTGNSSAKESKLGVFTFATGKLVEQEVTLAMPLALLDDKFVYVTPTGAIDAITFDPKTQRATGDPVTLEDGVVVNPNAGAKAALSPTGTLVFLRGRADYAAVLASAAAPVQSLLRDLGTYQTPRYSPEGKRVAITVVAGGATDIWVYDTSRNTFTRLTTEGVNYRPEWTPDGRYLIFISNRGGKVAIWRQPADGSAPAERFFEPPLEPYEVLVSPDAKWLLFRSGPGAANSRDIFAVPYEGDHSTVTPLVTGPFTDNMPRISPDGKWLAYQNNETGRFEIYVRPFPGNGARATVSDSGGTEPLWARNGKSLFYRGQLGEVIEVAVTTGTSFSIGARKVALRGDYLTDASHPMWDIAPDGRFLMLKRAGAAAQTIIIHGWAREVREKTAGKR